jgi:hypothetical protein
VVDAAQLKAVSDADDWTRTGTEISPKTAGDSVFTTGAVKVGGTTAAPNLQIKGDGGIVANTNGLVYDAATKHLGIGTTAPIQKFVVSDAGAAGFELDPSGVDSGPCIQGYNRSTSAFVPFTTLASHIAFRTGSSPTERARIDSSGRLLVGTSSTSSTAGLIVQGAGGVAPGIIRACYTTATPASGDTFGYLVFGDSAHSDAAWVAAARDGGTWSGSSKPTRLVFSTTADGASSPTEQWRIDSTGSLIGVAGSAFVAPYIYNITTATATNVNVDASGFLRRSTSSIKYKTNIETVEDQYSDALLQCRPVWYQSTCEADKPEWGHWGFIAEEVAQIDPRLCFFKEEEDGTLEPEGVQYDRFVPHLLNLIKRQNERIEALEAKVAALEAA